MSTPMSDPDRAAQTPLPAESSAPAESSPRVESPAEADPEAAPSDRSPDRVQRWSLWLLAVFVAESAAGSSGRWLEIGSISARQIIFAATLLVSAPLVWRRRAVVLAHPFVRITALVGVTLAAWAGWGLVNGNARGFVIADITTWSALALVPMVVALAPTTAQVHRLATVLFYSAVALAGFTLAMHLLAPTRLLPTNTISTWLTTHSLGGFADVGGGTLRVYLRSQALMIPALLVGLERCAAPGAGRRARIGYAAGSGALVMALFVSLTRSLWTGAAVAVGLFVIWHASRIRTLVMPLLATAAVAVVLFGVASAAYQRPALLQAATSRLSSDLIVVVPTAAPTVTSGVTPAPKRPTASAPATTPGSGRPSAGATTKATPTQPAQAANAEAARVRDQSLALHRQLIAQRPLVGWGLGRNLDAVRDDGRTEYLYWDLLMKLGVLGIVPLVLLYGWAPWQAVRRRTLPLARTLSAGLIGVAVTSYFNPFLNSTIGIALLLLTVAAVIASPGLAPAAARPYRALHRAPRRR